MFTPQVEYPQKFPRAELEYLYGYLTGEGDLHCAAKAAWNVLGFGMSFIPSDHPDVIGDDAAYRADSGMSAARNAAVLRMVLDAPNCETTKVGDVDVPAWVLLVLPIVRDLLDAWLERLLNR